MIGKTVGKYRIVERLGRGGMGTVYKAVDETLDREVAIKVLNADLGDTDLLKRFRAEAVTLARLNHPGIATLYELYRNDDELLMVMEFVRGETVHDFAERFGAIAPAQAAHLAMQVLDALSHAHRAGVVHRDLKPANLMITEQGSIKVMDFGIARVLGTEHFTQGGYMMGTPAYMAPEQVLGHEIDGRADLYAVGVVLYRLLSGQLPFSADTAIAMVQKQVNESPIPIEDFQPGLPPWCSRVLARALAKAPGDRFQTADDFRAALLSAVQPQALGEMPTMATPTPPGMMVTGEMTRPHQTPFTAGYAATQEVSPNAPPPASGQHQTAYAVAAGGAASTGTGAVPAAAGSGGGAGTTTVILGRNHLFGFAAIVALLIAGLGAVAFFALRHSSFPQNMQIGATPTEEAKAVDPSPGENPGEGAAATTADGQPAAPPPAAPAAPAAPAPPKPGDAAATAGTAAGRAGRGPVDGTVPVPPNAAAARGARGTTPPAEPAPPPTPAAPARESLPTVTFKDVRLLVTNGDKTQELNGVLSIGDGRVSVLDKDGGSPLMSLPYSALTGVTYSRSKQPKWKDAEGKEVTAKVDLGKLGFLRSERNWVILFSHADPIIFRVEDNNVRSVLPAIEERSGVKVQR